ncbi:MAG TPA: FtsX-like permease family protein [Vicinamibacteria bacterium]
MPSGTTLRIAWRNLWRNRRRTGLAVAAIGLSVALVLAYYAILRAYGDWILETLTGPMLGHVQIHASEWREDRALDRTIPDVSSILETLARDPEVASASARVYAPALAALAEEGFAVIVLGVDLEAESRPNRLLSGASPPRASGRALMGKMLAEVMGVREGDEIALVGQGADGSLANELVRVEALVQTPVDFVNRQGIVLDIGEAQTLFAMRDEAHELLVHARDPAGAKLLASRLQTLPALAGYEVLDWQSLAPEMLSLVEIIDVAGVFALVLVFVAAAAGVANTMLMATFERTHELGMLLALGTAPGRIVRMILVESVALGLTGAALGGSLGVLLVALTHERGLDFAALTGGGPTEISFAGLNWSLRFYPTLALSDVGRTIVAVLLTSLVASAWPAWRAARLEPARALRD